MSSPVPDKARLLHSATVVARPIQLQVLACRRCGNNSWVVEVDRVLRCQSCLATLPFKDNVVDCVQRVDSVSSSANDWSMFYQSNFTSYSSKADWWTLSSWRRDLFREIRESLSDKLVVDFGCGTAVRIATLIPIQTHSYRYVGIDSSLDALRRGAEVLPGAFFIHADLAVLSLTAERADVVLCLGVLMYFEKFTKALERFLHVLKPGGTMLLHEQIRRKSWTETVHGLFSSSQRAYPASRGVQRKDLIQYLKGHGSIVHIHLAGSPWRRLFMTLLDGTSFESIRPFAVWLDRLWCATAGRAFPSVGASEIQIIFRKSARSESSAMQIKG